jgi:hypothetical protein
MLPTTGKPLRHSRGVVGGGAPTPSLLLVTMLLGFSTGIMSGFLYQRHRQVWGKPVGGCVLRGFFKSARAALLHAMRAAPLRAAVCFCCLRAQRITHNPPRICKPSSESMNPDRRRGPARR